MRKTFVIFFLSCLVFNLHAQVLDSGKMLTADTIKKVEKKNIPQKHDPKIATRRSLILPGWGQAYNKEYWKIPLVYGALAIPTITFIYNNNIYKEAKFAYEARYKATLPGATKADSADYYSLDSKYQKADVNAIQTLRNAARRDRDYSIFWFLIVWGLNVADATVFGHLKDFDVSNNLSLNIRPEFNPNTRSPGLSFTLKPKNKLKPLPFVAR